MATSKSNIEWDTESSAHTISINWRPHDTDATYVVKFKEKATKKFITEHADKNLITLNGLKEETHYEIKVFVENDEGDQKELFQVSVATKTSITGEMKKMSTVIKEGNISIYTLNTVFAQSLGTNVRECHLISKAHMAEEEKTIMLMGESGSGKTTLIDAMFNYIAGVSCNDDHRFRIVNLTTEEEAKRKTQALSQTNTITVYKIPKVEGFATNFALNIIDTPGFGDTGGIEEDKKIPELIKVLFEKSVVNLNAVCLVTKLSCNRIRTLEKEVFGSVMNIFGKDIKNNIYACLTHDDGGKLHALDAMHHAKVQFNETTHFRFNNSTLFSSEKSAEAWNKRNDNFKRFFEEVAKSEPQSLIHTKAVLKTRELLQVQLQNVRENLKTQIEHITKAKNRQAMLLKFKKEIENNENFNYEEISIEKVKNYSSRTNLNCPTCKISCHIDCSPWGINWTCVVMGFWYCNICSCSCTSHVNENYVYSNETKKVTKTRQDMFDAYKNASNNASTHKDMLETEKLNLQTALSNLDNILDSIKTYRSKLNEIALTPNTLTFHGYIAQIVKEEEKRLDDHGLKKARLAVLNKLADTVAKERRAVEMVNELLEMDFPEI